MRLVLFLIFSWNCKLLLSQNILSNGDFENNIGAGYGKVYNAQTWEIAGQANQNNTPDLIGTGFYGLLGNNSTAFDQTGNFYVGWFGNESFATFMPYKIPSDRPFKIKFRYAFNSHNYNFIPENPTFTFVFSEDKPDELYKIVGNCFKIDKPKKINVQKEYQLNLEKIPSNEWGTYESDWIIPGNKDLGQWLTIIGMCVPNITPGYQFIDDIEIFFNYTCPTCTKVNLPLVPGIKMNVFTPNTDGQNDILYHEYENMTSYDLYVTDRSGARVYCVENQWPAISSSGKPAVAWDGSKTNFNCKKIGGNSSW